MRKIVDQLEMLRAYGGNSRRHFLALPIWMLMLSTSLFVFLKKARHLGAVSLLLTFCLSLKGQDINFSEKTTQPHALSLQEVDAVAALLHSAEPKDQAWGAFLTEKYSLHQFVPVTGLTYDGGYADYMIAPAARSRSFRRNLAR
jgi:hypothetical protein